MNNATRAHAQSFIQAETVRASDLASLLDKYGDKITVLSLDCFDTVLWRNTATPKDVFYDLQHRSQFKLLGINALMRMNAEGRARQLKMLQKNTSEVNLHDIFSYAFPELTENEYAQLIEEEMQAELEACFAFPPFIELIRVAHRRGLRLIIVSDTYLQEQQLRRLLAAKLPTDIYESIEKIVCSSDVGQAKTDDLFYYLLQELKCNPEQILHIGDNILGDFSRPRGHAINALQFVQQDEYINDLLRLQEIAGKMINPNVGATMSLSSPYRGIFAQQKFTLDRPERLIGYTSLGPIMYAFAQFICDEVDMLRHKNPQTKAVFLMRDAYLPSLACEQLAEYEVGKRVRISRFSSFAASFRTEEDIDQYLIEIGQTNRFNDVTRQLLLPQKVADPIIQSTLQSKDQTKTFLSLIRRRDIVNIILNKSAKFRARLMRHLENEINLQAGDTLVLVDLGYSGTTQKRLTNIFKEKGIEVVGRYLLSLRVPGWESNRRGLIDPSWCDDKAMHTIVFYITLLEQLCTSNENSVVDYDESGNPIYSDVKMHDEQYDKLAQIQAQCMLFVKDARTFFNSINIKPALDILRHTTLTELTRMIFLSTSAELDYLQTFEAEMNLGTTDILRVFDPEKGLIGLRRRGMFYMEKPSKLTRTNYPAELRTAGIELALSLIAQHRFGLDLKLKDIIIRKEMINILFKQEEQIFKTTLEAIVTHDGYFAVWLPANLKSTIMLGEKYQWLQIESAEFIHMEAFIHQNETKNTLDAKTFLIFENMQEHGENLFELRSSNSAVSIKPFTKLLSTSGLADFVLRLVFRPIIKREQNNALSSNTIDKLVQTERATI
jgi:predicted HAD superfamily hydrolase